MKEVQVMLFVYPLLSSNALKTKINKNSPQGDVIIAPPLQGLRWRLDPGRK
jgi:hypothetical protein